MKKIGLISCVIWSITFLYIAIEHVKDVGRIDMISITAGLGAIVWLFFGKWLWEK